MKEYKLTVWCALLLLRQDEERSVKSFGNFKGFIKKEWEIINN